MATLTILTVGAVTVMHADGGATRNGNPITTSLWGDGFSWEVPDNLVLTFDFSKTATLNFSDTNGILTDDPYVGDVVVDQRLTQSVTIGNRTWTANSETVRWKYPPPIYVEDEYHVILFDDLGNRYEMVGISITTGYEQQVVGIAFLGAAPPEGTALHYIQGVSSYIWSGSSPIPDLTVIPAAAPCFVRGTLIATPTGPQAIEVLEAGDLVMTADNGAQPVIWAGHSRVGGTGKLAPVRIRAGHIGNSRDLVVSQNHRVLVSGYMAQLLFGEDEVLVAAKHLVDGRHVTVEPVATVEYFHLLLDRHEILLAEGAPAESLYLGTETMQGLSAAARSEIEAIFPEEPWARATHPPTLSRPALKGREGRLLGAA